MTRKVVLTPYGEHILNSFVELIKDNYLHFADEKRKKNYKGYEDWLIDEGVQCVLPLIRCTEEYVAYFLLSHKTEELSNAITAFVDTYAGIKVNSIFVTQNGVRIYYDNVMRVINKSYTFQFKN